MVGILLCMLVVCKQMKDLQEARKGGFSSDSRPCWQNWEGHESEELIVTNEDVSSMENGMSLLAHNLHQYKNGVVYDLWDMDIRWGRLINSSICTL
mgnify:CR=1 FL=1